MKRYAFTLSELLVSTLIISVIMVVLAPVITKRVSDNINVTGGGSTKKDSRLFKYDLTDTDCTQVSGQRTLSCKFTPKSGVKSVNVVMLSGGGGGGGSTLESKQTNQTNQTTSGTTTINITQYIKNIRVTLAGAGGGGGSSAGAVL